MVLILSAIGMTIFQVSYNEVTTTHSFIHSVLFVCVKFQAIIGGFFYMETLSYQTSKIAWLPLASIIGYISLYSLGKIVSQPFNLPLLGHG